MAMRVFTVVRGVINPGVHVRKCISASGEIIFAIIIGRDKDNPGLLPIKGIHEQHRKEGNMSAEVQVVEFDATTLELTACSDTSEVDDEQILVVFSAQARGDIYYQGGTQTESQAGFSRQVSPLNPKAYSPVYPEAHFVQLLSKDETVTVHARFEKTFHTEFYSWDGDRLLPTMKRNTLSTF